MLRYLPSADERATSVSLTLGRLQELENAVGDLPERHRVPIQLDLDERGREGKDGYRPSGSNPSVPRLTIYCNRVAEWAGSQYFLVSPLD